MISALRDGDSRGGSISAPRQQQQQQQQRRRRSRYRVCRLAAHLSSTKDTMGPVSAAATAAAGGGGDGDDGRPLVYLASGLGFSAQERANSIPPLVSALEAAGGW